MPAPVAPSVSARSAVKHGSVKPQQAAAKTRIVRRRGRANDLPESDDEIEREAGTDSDSDDDHSSPDSGSESGAESVHEQGPVIAHSRPFTPSSGGGAPQDLRSVPKSAINGGDQPSFFGNPSNWSEMVADETANGPADLPVIDFEDLDRHALHDPSDSSTRARKSHKPQKRSISGKPSSTPAQMPGTSAPTSVKDGHDDQEPSEQSVASSSRQPVNGTHPKRPVGQTARQAYQQRLESDPSYVPTVGEFWGHDDRLLDKDLRSLSGWWRGRWQGRGRGRGGFDRGFAMRGRGRGGGFPRHQISAPPDQPPPQGRVQTEEAPHPADVAPIEQHWTHDGFEEMKRKDEQRRAQEQPTVQPFRGLSGFRGRGSAGRGRGALHHGGSVTSPSSRPRAGLPPSQPTERHRFTMRLERTWTKQHDAFLHFDSSLKARNGHGPAYRIKLPKREPHILRAPAASLAALNQQHVVPPAESASGSDDGEKKFVVRLPPRIDHRPATKVVPQEELISAAVEPPLDDVFIVKPERAERIFSAPAMITPDVHRAATDILPDAKDVQRSPPARSLPSAIPNANARQQLEQISPEAQNHVQPASSPRWIEAEVAVLNPTPSETQPLQAGPAQPRSSHNVLPPLQTTFTPVPRSSPSFGSPYTYQPALPPGIAMNQHGMPYELATGRAVYLQPPPAMYNPRPVMHSHVAPSGVSFVPGHMHHHSTVSSTPDFVAHPTPHTPPMNGFVDPSSGMPIFSLPRSSRIEIRAPTEQADGKTSGKPFPRRPSGLRSNQMGFEPPTAAEDAGDQRPMAESAYSTPETNHPEGLRATGQPGVDGVMYPFYQQQYYYPEAYGYPQYMEVSQVAPYEMYSPDPRAGQSAVYY